MMRTLDIEKIQILIEARGLKQSWVIKQMELKPTAGHLLLQYGALPKDKKKADKALHGLTRALGIGRVDLFKKEST